MTSRFTKSLLIYFLLFCACNGSTFSINQDTTLDDDTTQISENFEAPQSDSIYDLTLDADAGYPVAEANFILSSPFGPRLKASDNLRYDFHRGIDIPGSVGDPIYAVTNGTLYAAYPDGSSAYPDGGNVVVIEHELATPITFHGESVSRFYTVYLHLKDFGEAAENYLVDGTKSMINKGETIGGMGSTGDTDFTHLHFEVRLATPCSLEFQNANTDSSCAGFDFDPHVNPLALYANDFSAAEQDISFTSGSTTAVTVAITSEPDVLIVDGLTLEIFDSADFTNLLDEQTVSFNLRESFDATSTASLDESDLGNILVSPYAFNTSSEAYEIDFEFTLDTTLWESRSELFLRATLLNTFGPDTTVAGRLAIE